MSIKKKKHTLRSLSDIQAALASLNSAPAQPKPESQSSQVMKIAEKIEKEIAAASSATVEAINIPSEEVFLQELSVAIADANYKKAHALTASAMKSRTVPTAIRSKLAPLFNALSTVRAHAKPIDTAAKGYAVYAARIESVNDALSAFNMSVQGRNSFSRVGSIAALPVTGKDVIWPDLVTTPVVIDSFRMLLSIRGQVPPDLGASLVAGSTFITDCRLLAVADKGSEKDAAAVKAAQRYCLAKNLGALIPLPMRRMDSDGVWFAISKVPVEVASLEFMDRVRMADAGPALNETVRILRVQKQRERRVSFEQSRETEFTLLRRALTEIEVLEDRSTSLRVAFQEMTGFLPSIRDARLVSETQRLMQVDLAGEKDPMARVTTRLRWEELMIRAMAIRVEYQDVRRQIKIKRNEASRLQHAIDNAKAMVLNPTRQLSARAPIAALQ